MVLHGLILQGDIVKITKIIKHVVCFCLAFVMIYLVGIVVMMINWPLYGRALSEEDYLMRVLITFIITLAGYLYTYYRVKKNEAEAREDET